jgi:hypothetical protein
MEALTIAQMLEMMNGIKTPEPVTTTLATINNGVIRLFKLVQPVRNSSLQPNSQRLQNPYTGKINSTRFILQNLKIQRL